MGQDRKQYLSLACQYLEFVADIVAAEGRQAMQAQVQDRLYLRYGQPKGRAFLHIALDRFDEADIGGDFAVRPFAQQQRLARRRRRRRSADDADDFVEVAHRDDTPKHDLRTVARLGEIELAAG